MIQLEVKKHPSMQPGGGPETPSAPVNWDQRALKGSFPKDQPPAVIAFKRKYRATKQRINTMNMVPNIHTEVLGQRSDNLLPRVKNASSAAFMSCDNLNSRDLLNV